MACKSEHDQGGKRTCLTACSDLFSCRAKSLDDNRELGNLRAKVNLKSAQKSCLQRPSGSSRLPHPLGLSHSRPPHSGSSLAGK